MKYTHILRLAIMAASIVALVPLAAILVVTQGCTETTRSSSTPAGVSRPAGCGDGQVAALEVCDPSVSMVYSTCAAQGLGSTGNVTCTTQCTLNLSACSVTDYCQANNLYNNLRCDNCRALGGMADPDCATYCSAEGNCASYFDTLTGRYTCNPPDPDCGTCGNDTLEAPELCDGTAATGLNCTDYGYDAGTLGCTNACTPDFANCTFNCGNGMLDGGEACDGALLNGQTCTTLGQAGTGLRCAADCTFDTSSCTGANTGAETEPNNDTASCDTLGNPPTIITGAGDGTFDFFCITVQAGTTLDFDIDASELGSSLDTIMSLFDTDGTTTLMFSDDDGSPNDTNPGVDSYFRFTFTTAGTYYIRIGEFPNDPVPAGLGSYELHVTVGGALPPETNCNNMNDDDGDGLVDCEDPTNCQATAACIPGSTPTGGPCTVHSDCISTVGLGPLCGDSSTGATNGYCSEHCDILSNNCGTGRICADIGNPITGACLKLCSSVTECRQAEGYVCSMAFGLTQTVCAATSW